MPIVSEFPPEIECDSEELEKLLDLHAPVWPWTYNPSAWSQRIPICILAGIGFLISSYLALYQWKLLSFAWDPVFGDQTMKVLDSEVSEYLQGWFIVPDAALGALAYLGDAVFGLGGSTRRWQYRPWLVIAFGIDVIPLGLVSAILIFMQGAVVGSWCSLCMMTAVISLILVYFAVDEVGVSCLYLYRVWRRSRSLKVLWSTFCGIPTEEGYQIGIEMVQGAIKKKNKQTRSKRSSNVG